LYAKKKDWKVSFALWMILIMIIEIPSVINVPSVFDGNLKQITI